jgi:hypothetical protein
MLVSLCAACGQPAEPAPAPSSTQSRAVAINPARIDRARGELPVGYEVAGYTGPPAPIALWGFGDAAVSEPPQCRPLAAPAVDPATTKGWSASGPGGIVYAVVARSGDPLPPVPVLLAECAQWTVQSGHTAGTVATGPGPAVDAAQTIAMSTAATTVVEGGTETRSHAETFVAYLGDYVCFVALVTDPGSPYPTLDAGFAADLLTAAVSALRG